MTALFAFATYLAALVVIGVACFGFDRYDTRYGADGSFLVMAVVFAIFLPTAALGFHFAKGTFVHRARPVVLAGLSTGIGGSLLVLLCGWLSSSQVGVFLVPLVAVFLASAASARLLRTGAQGL